MSGGNQSPSLRIPAFLLAVISEFPFFTVENYSSCGLVFATILILLFSNFRLHMYFLAEALEAKGHLRSATPATLATALEAFPNLGSVGDSDCGSDGNGFVPYPQTQPEAFAALVDETMGFPPLPLAPK